MRFITIAAVAFATMPLPGCEVAAREPASAPATRSAIAFNLLDRLDREQAQAVAAELPGEIAVQNGVRLYRLQYKTRLNGKLIAASALLALPDGGEPMKGLVLYLKGSDIPRTAAPTMSGAVWQTEPAVYAGNGYAVLVPDYIGFGAAPSPQAFLLIEENLTDFRSALKAARKAIGFDGTQNLFLHGFSQGAQLTAALHRDLEAQPLEGYRLQTSVAASGPHELAASFARRLDGPLKSDPIAKGYLAWAAFTFAWANGVELDTVFTKDFAQRAPIWFGGDLGPMEIFPQLPENGEELFQPEFLRQARTNLDFWFNRQLKASETWNWAPKRPLHLVIGSADTNVDPESTRALFDRAQALGGAISATELPNLDHRQTGDTSYAIALARFEAISGQARKFKVR